MTDEQIIQHVKENLLKPMKFSEPHPDEKVLEIEND